MLGHNLLDKNNTEAIARMYSTIVDVVGAINLSIVVTK